MFLTPEELTEFTDYKRPADQIRWLTERGYRFEVGASGRPKVLRSVIEKRLGVSGRAPAPKAPRFDLVNG